MAKYLYRGPVMEFDRCIVNNWTGQTEAPSEAKAKSNLSYQFKKYNNRTANTKITLPGKRLVRRRLWLKLNYQVIPIELESRQRKKLKNRIRKKYRKLFLERSYEKRTRVENSRTQSLVMT